MKINTITCHDVYNHGASLQAYALQHYLQSEGHDVEIIHYKPDYLSRHFNLWMVANPIFDKPIVKQLYLLAKLPGRLCSLKRKAINRARNFAVMRHRLMPTLPVAIKFGTPHSEMAQMRHFILILGHKKC